MIIVDKALKEREEQQNLINVGIIGAGFMGRGTTLTIEKSVPGMRVAALYNRTLERAELAYRQAGVKKFKQVNSASEIDEVIRSGGYSVTDNPMAVCRSEEIDVVIEATGEIEFGAKVVLEAFSNGKDVVLMNAELDATLGPLLKKRADEAGVVITNADGDQPGVLMNLYRFVDMIGYNPVLMGNIKGLQDPYRTPETQKAFAEQHKQKPKMVTSFADGTKISMEMAVVANATGFRTKKRGMTGPECSHVKDALEHFSEEDLMNGGMVDYILGAEPGPGVFIIAHNEDPVLQGYAKYLKMGDGPFYLFYVPYHLPHLEVASSAARAVLFNDAVIAPAGPPICEVITLAKRDLKAGEVLDGIGGFMVYGTLENSDIARIENLMPMGLAEGSVVKRDIGRDKALTMDDIEFPDGRLCDKLWQEQRQLFSI